MLNYLIKQRGAVVGGKVQRYQPLKHSILHDSTMQWQGNQKKTSKDE